MPLLLLEKACGVIDDFGLGGQCGYCLSRLETRATGYMIQCSCSFLGTWLLVMTCRQFRSVLIGSRGVVGIIEESG